MTRPHRLKALMLAEFMIRSGTQRISGRHRTGHRYIFVVDGSGTGTGHRVAATHGPAIIEAANRLASRARRRGGRIEPKDIEGDTR